jgi:carboxyl-terminal processing protease
MKMKQAQRSIPLFKKGPIVGSLLGISLAVVVMIHILTVHANVSPSDIEPSFDLIASTMSQIEKNSFKSDDPKSMIYAGIHGMLRTLDPYSHFLEEDAFKFTQEQQGGSFYGIGISFDIRNGQLLVVAPIEGSPAWKLGIKPGDVIVEIEDESAAGITTANVVNKLRGKKGTPVTITVKRPGITEPLKFQIIRDRIELNSVRGGFILDGNIGYVRIGEFSSTTGEEMESILTQLKVNTLSGLILDLRFNGGGLLAAAEDVSSLFLEKDQLIVSTEGERTKTKAELRTKKTGLYSTIPLIVLVNEHSASASEIVAGAIQDHDRGIILGKPTHGKGLVGSQFPTKLGTAVQITSAQYFTPSGRFIQRPYNIPHRKSEPVTVEEITGEPERYRTDDGRIVFGGGGILPDVTVEEPALSRNMFILEDRGAFFDFAVKHGRKWEPVDLKFQISEEIFDAFVAYCESEKVPLEMENLDREKICSGLKREMFSVYISSDAGEKVRVENLLTVREALKLFPELKTILSADTSGIAEQQPTPGA